MIEGGDTRIMRKLLKTSIHIAVLSLLSLGFADRVDAEGVHFDFEQKFFFEFGFEVKDHCLIRDGSTYHLFYLRGNPAVDIGHATSPDLKHWTMLPPVLYTATAYFLEGRLQDICQSEIEEVYIGDAQPLLDGSARLRDVVNRNIDQYLQRHYLHMQMMLLH